MPRREECAKAQPQPLSESEIAAAIWQSEAAQCRVNAPPAVVITGLVTPGVVVRAGDKSARFVVEFPPAETTVLQTTPPEACPPGQPSVTPEQAAASGCPTQVTPEQAVVQPTTTQVTPEQAAVQPATTQVAPEQAVVQPTTTQQSTLVQVSPVQPCDQPPPPFHRHFHGLNLGLIKIGIDDRGSFAFGCNVGIAKVDTRIGRLTGVDAGAGLGPIGANGGVGVNFETDGIHGHVNAAAGAANAIRGGFGFGAQVGPKTGFNTMVDAKVGPAHTRHGVSSYVGDEGFNTGYEGNVGIAKAFGVGARGHVGLNENSSAGAEAGIRAGSSSIGSGVDVDTDGNRVIHPDVTIVKARSEAEEGSLHVGAQVGPKFDARVGLSSRHENTVQHKHSEDNGDLTFQVGESGVGFKAFHTDDKAEDERGFGFGPSFEY